MNNNNINNINNKKNEKNTIITPIVTYSNAYIHKVETLKANKRKSGIYRLNNLITGKSYIGSSINLARRFSNYYSIGYLENRVKKGSSIIYNSLLKYGYSSFSIDILEYCELDVLRNREQYYMDILKPEYNILKIAGNSLGYKHSEVTKAKMSINNTGKKHTYEVRKKIGFSLKSIIKVNSIPKVITSQTRLKLASRSKGVNVKVYDKSNNLVKEFPTITSAAKYFGVSNKTIGRIFKTGIPYNDNYIYKFEIKDTRVWIYDYNHKLVNIFENTLKASVWCKIPYNTMSRYIKSGKLYKNKYYFYNTK